MDIQSYISGFVDGEGCFCVSFNRSQRHKFGWDVRPSFSISQNSDRAQLLYQIKEMWGCGSIRPDRSDKTLKYEVRALDDLLEKVLSHFDAYPLLSAKQKDYEIFRAICLLMKRGRHLQAEGIRKIVDLAFKMNSTGKRKYSESDVLASL